MALVLNAIPSPWYVTKPYTLTGSGGVSGLTLAHFIGSGAPTNTGTNYLPATVNADGTWSISITLSSGEANSKNNLWAINGGTSAAVLLGSVVPTTAPVTAPGPTPTYLPANASFYTDASGNGVFSFHLTSGLPSGSHSLSVAFSDDKTVNAQSNQFTVASGNPGVTVYPSVQSQVVPMINRPGFNPNLNVPYGNDQFTNFFNNRDWTNTIALGYAGMGGVAGWRNQPSWRRTLSRGYGSYGAYDMQWDVAFRTIMSVQARPGSSTILDIFTNVSHYMIPAGEPMVFWIPTVKDDGVTALTIFPFTNFSFPLKTIMTTVDATVVNPWVDGSGNKILDSSGNPQTVHKYGIQLPAGMTVPAGLYWDQRAGVAAKSLTTPILYGRHNSFYKDSQTLQPRWQIAQMLNIGRYYVCQNGGVFCYGGDQGEPTYYDYWRERQAFGDTIAYAFLGGEADYVGGVVSQFPDPSRVLIELENEPTGPWNNVVNGVDNGVRDMIVNFLMPRWRAALGPKYTIGVKGTAFGSLAWGLANFDIVFPNDGPYAYIAHIYARQANYSTHYPDITNVAASNYNTNGSQIYFNNDTDGKYCADAMSVIKARSGATIAGWTEWGIPWEDTQLTTTNSPSRANSNEAYRGRVIGIVNSAMANAGHFVFYWSYADDNGTTNYYAADGLTYNANNADSMLEMWYPPMRNEAVLANTAAPLAGLKPSSTFPTYTPVAVNTVPAYAITAPGFQVSTPAGATTSSFLLLGSTHGYGGTVTVSATTLPAGITVALSSATFSNIGAPANMTGPGDVCTVAVTVAPSVVAGPYSIVFTATDGTVTQTEAMNISVTAPTTAASFAISPTSFSLPVAQSSAASVSLTLSPQGAYMGTDAISIGTLPSGVTASVSPTSITSGTGTAVITFTASSSATIASSNITITVTDGSLTRTAIVNLVVTAPLSGATYKISPTSVALNVTQGAAASTLLTLTASGGYTGTDNFSISGLPAGVTASFSTTSIINGAGTVTLTLAATTSAAVASSALTVTVTDGTINKTAIVTLNVVAAPVPTAYTLSPISAVANVTQGASSAPVTLTLASTGGYTGTDAFAIGALPNGITAVLSSPTLTNGTGSTSVTFTASGSAAAGVGAVPITCSDGASTQTCVITLTVVPSTPTVPVVTVDPQNPLYVTPNGSFSGSIVDPTMSLSIALTSLGMPLVSSSLWLPATVQPNGKWTITGIPITTADYPISVYALVAGTTVVTLETVIPVNPTGNPTPTATQLLVGPTVVSTDGTGAYVISAGAVSGGVTPYLYQFQRVLYSAGSAGSAQPIGPSGAATTYTDTSVPVNTTAGYSLTVTDNSSPFQTVTTAQTVITYGTAPASGSGSKTADDVYAYLNSILEPQITTILDSVGNPTQIRY